MTFVPLQRQASPTEAGNWWGQYDTLAGLPNVAGSDVQLNEELQAGDQAYVADIGAMVWCSDPTPNAAVWEVLALSAATTQQDIYVAPGAANASDDNPGTIAEPLETIDAAIDMINGFQVILAPIIVHLESGTYTMSQVILAHVMRERILFIGDGAGQPGDDGWTELLNDTAQAGSSASTIVSSGGLTPEAFVGKQLIITSGAAIDFRKTINDNDANDIIPATQVIGFAPGDTFRVVEPAVVINLNSDNAAADYNPNLNPGILGCGGDDVQNSGVRGMVAFVNARFTSSSGTYNFLDVKQSTVGFFGCEFDVTINGFDGINVDGRSTLLLGTDTGAYFFGTPRTLFASEVLGIRTDDPRAWGSYGIWLDDPANSNFFSSVKGNVTGVIHMTGSVGALGLNFASGDYLVLGGSLILDSDRALLRVTGGAKVTMVRAGAFHIPMILRSDGTGECIEVEGGSVRIDSGAIELAKDGTGIPIVVTSNAGSPQLASLSIDDPVIAASGTIPANAMVATNGGVILVDGSDAGVTGFGVGTEVAVRTNGSGGALVQQKDISGMAAGEVLPNAGTSDMRDGSIRRL